MGFALNKEMTFFALLIGIFVVGLFGVGLVISAFIGKRVTRAGRVRAIIGAVLMALCVTAVLMM